MQEHADTGESRLPAGRILALDLGEKRIGVAISDPTQTLASSYAVIKRSSRRHDFAELAAIVAREGVHGLVIGLPIRNNDVEGALAAWVRDYAADLSESLGLPYLLKDESFTTQRAGASLRARGKKSKQQRGWVDAVAAAILLQDYLSHNLSGECDE